MGFERCEVLHTYLVRPTIGNYHPWLDVVQPFPHCAGVSTTIRAPSHKLYIKFLLAILDFAKDNFQ
jgi:hypothetical protein